MPTTKPQTARILRYTTATLLTASLLNWAGAGTAVAQGTPGDDDITLTTTTLPGTVLTLDMGGNDTVTIDTGNVITSTSAGASRVIFVANSAGFTLNNAGTIDHAGANTFDDTILIASSTGSFVVDNTGSILRNGSTLDGVAAVFQVNTDNLGLDVSITNSGTIAGRGQGLVFGNANGRASAAAIPSTTITNQSGGLIQATLQVASGGGFNDALVLGNGDNIVVNELGATIDGEILFGSGDDSFTNAGALLDTGNLNFADGDDSFTNSAALTTLTAITLGNGNDSLINSAAITAPISAGAGDDTITNNVGGNLTGLITLGAGDDTITNSGTITGTPLLTSSGDGLIVFESGLNSLNNTATGTIEATGADRAAIRIDAVTSGGPSDSITNAGLITATAEAIFVAGSGTDLTNGIINLAGGQIIGDSDNSGPGFNGNSAVRVSGAALSGGLNNAGLIEHNTINAVAFDGFDNVISGQIVNASSGTIRGGSSGIVVSSFDLTAGIDNAGTITGTAGSGIVLGGSSSSFSGGITNQAGGVISGGANGILLSGFATSGAVAIDNSGTIAGTGAAGRGISVSGASSPSAFSGGITNQAGGVITGGAAGVSVNGSAGDSLSGGISNSGTISSTGAGGAAIFAQSGNTFGGVITNAASGVITGDTGVSLNGTTVASGIDNSGTITGTGGTAIALSGLTEATPITINGGRIVGDVVDAAPSGGFTPVTVTGSGFATEGDFFVSDLVVNASQDFTISAGDNINLDTQSASAGTLIFEVGETSVAQLNVTGTGNGINLTGATVEAVVDPDRPLADGDEILIGTGNAPVVGLTGVTGQALTDITDDSALFDFEIADGGQADVTTNIDNSNLFLLATQVATAAETALTPNAQRAGASVDGLVGTTDPQLVALVTQIGLAGTPQEVENLLQSALPSIDRSSLDVAAQLTNHTVRLVSDRLTVIREHDGALAPDRLSTISHHAGPAEPLAHDEHTTLQPWAQVFGQRVDREFSDNVEGFDATSFGFSVGLDTGGLSETAVAGLAFSYSDTDVQSQSINRTQSDIDSFNVTLYGDYDLDDESYLAGDVGLTFSQHNATRFDVAGVAGQNAQADFDSLQFSARLIAARELLLDDGWVLTPKALARYVRFDADSFTETGAGGASLSVSDTGADILEFGAIVDLRKQFDLDDGGLLSTDVSVGYRYDVIGEAIETTSSFVGGGPAFVSQGADPDQGTLNLGAGVGYTSPDRWEVTLNYDYELRGDTESHAANVRLAIPF